MAFFGTDGIRGIAGQDLTARTAFALGNALVRTKRGARIVLGRDTRVSSDMLALALAAGAAAGGGIVLDGGVLPTAAVSFFVRREGADYGVVVSASHNPPEYNGLKVFGADGRKLADEEEGKLERLFGKDLFAPSLHSGRRVPLRERNGYADYLVSCCGVPLAGKTFVLDCANGAAGAFAPRVFRRLGARVVALNCRADGRHVNENCGALHPNRMRRAVVAAGADAGFCYDGDADRLIAADEEGKLVDGDKLLYIFARERKARGKLPHDLAVGTAHGRYKKAPVLAIDRIREIKKATKVSLVLHGGSGVPDDQIRAAIDAGIRKVNFGTDLCYAFLDKVFETDRNKVAIDLFMADPVNAVKAFAASKIQLLGAAGKA